MWPTLLDTRECSLLGSSVHEIFQARIMEWVAIFLSRGSSQPRDWTLISSLLHSQAGSLSLAPPGMTSGYLMFSNSKNSFCISSIESESVSHSVVSDSMGFHELSLLSMEFSRQEYWNGLPFPSPGDLPEPGINPGSPALQANSLASEPPGKPLIMHYFVFDVWNNCVEFYWKISNKK